MEKSRNPLAIYFRSGELKPVFQKRKLKNEAYEKLQIKKAKVELADLKTENLDLEVKIV